MPPLPPGRSSKRVLPLVVFAAIVASGLLAARPAFADDGTRQSYHQTLKPNQSVSLDASGDLGADIRVIGGSSDLQVSSDARGRYADRVRMSEELVGQTLRIKLDVKPGDKSFLDWLHLNHTEVKVLVRIPRASNLSVSSVNGPIVVNGVSGPLAIRLVNGPIDVNGSGAVLSLHSVNGPIQAEIVDLSHVPDIAIHTTNGAIDVSVPKGFRAAVHASTVFGPIDNNVASSGGPGTMTISLVAGPITINQR